MIYCENSAINNLAVHFVGNKMNNDLCHLSKSTIQLKENDKALRQGLLRLRPTCGSGAIPAVGSEARNLGVPIGSSIEQLCMSTGLDRFYVNNIGDAQWAPEIDYVRAVGNRWNLKQFVNMNIEDEFDAFLFFDSVDAMPPYTPL